MVVTCNIDPVDQIDRERVRAGYASIDSDGVPDPALFDPDVEWHNAPELPGATDHRGIEAMTADIRAQAEAWEERHFEPVDVIEDARRRRRLPAHHRPGAVKRRAGGPRGGTRADHAQRQGRARAGLPRPAAGAAGCGRRARLGDEHPGRRKQRVVTRGVRVAVRATVPDAHTVEPPDRAA